MRRLLFPVVVGIALVFTAGLWIGFDPAPLVHAFAQPAFVTPAGDSSCPNLPASQMTRQSGEITAAAASTYPGGHDAAGIVASSRESSLAANVSSADCNR